MLAISSSRKKKLVAVSFRQSNLPYTSFRYYLTVIPSQSLFACQVQLAVNDLRESANIKISKLRQETLTMQDSTSSVKAEWKIHMEKTESNYHEDTSAVESGKNDLVEILRYWYGIWMFCPYYYSLLFTEPHPNQTIVQPQEGRSRCTTMEKCSGVHT